MNDFIIEHVADLSFDPKQCPLSKKIRETWIKLISTNNPIMDNGQMVCLIIPGEIRNKIFDYGQKVLIEFIESEKMLNECDSIKNKYISNEDIFVKSGETLDHSRSSDIYLSRMTCNM